MFFPSVKSLHFVLCDLPTGEVILSLGGFASYNVKWRSQHSRSSVSYWCMREPMDFCLHAFRDGFSNCIELLCASEEVLI